MSQQSQQAPWPTPAQGWYVVGVLFIAYIFSYVDRTILALLVEPIRADLGLSDTLISLLHGFAFVVFYTVLGVPLARVADRHNRVRLIAAGIVVWSLATAACGLAGSFWELALGRVMVGVGEAVLSPAAYSLIADYFSPERRGRASGFYASGAFLGAGVAFLIGGIVVSKLLTLSTIELPVIGALQPWQLTFIVVGAPGLLVAAWVWTLREPIRREAHTSGGTIAEVAAFLRRNGGLLLAHNFGFAFLAGAFGCIVAWLPTYFIRMHGFDAAQAGFAVGGALAVFGTAGVISGGLLADVFQRRGHVDGTMRVGVIAGVGMVPFAVLLGAASADWLAIAAVCPLCFFATFPFGCGAAALQQLVPNRMRAQIIALYFLVTNLVAAGFGPLTAAMLTEHVFESPELVGVSIATLSTVWGLIGAGIILLGLRPFRAALATNAQGVSTTNLETGAKGRTRLA